MLILKFWPTYPLLAKRNFLGLVNPVRESGTPAYLRSLKMLPIDLPSHQTCRAKFLGHFKSQFRIYGHFKVLSKKFQQPLSPFRFFSFFHGKSISSYSFKDIGMRFSAFNAQVNWLQNVGSGILNFWPENYLEPPKVKKKLKNFF